MLMYEDLGSKHVSRQEIRVLALEKQTSCAEYGLQSKILPNQGERASALHLLGTCDELDHESWIANL